MLSKEHESQKNNQKNMFGDIRQNGLKLQKITYSFTEYYNDPTG